MDKIATRLIVFKVASHFNYFYDVVCFLNFAFAQVAHKISVCCLDSTRQFSIIQYIRVRLRPSTPTSNCNEFFLPHYILREHATRSGYYHYRPHEDIRWTKLKLVPPKLKKRKVLHLNFDRHVDTDTKGTMARLTTLISDHGEEISGVPTNDTATRLDDIESENGWDWLMGGKKDSLMLINRRLGKSRSSQGQDRRNEEWEEHTASSSSTPALLTRARKNSFVARSA